MSVSVPGLPITMRWSKRPFANLVPTFNPIQVQQLLHMLALALRILSFSRLHQTIGANRETCNFLEGSAAGPYQVPSRALAAAKSIGGGAAWAETRPLFQGPLPLTPAPGFGQPLHGHSGSSLISFNDIGYWYWFDTKWRGEEEAIRAQPERGPSWLRNPT